ncbi:MAG: autotransporter adhesin family protein [Nanoarchaeota archaeon]|nr:autotransporter adhesin family protein [Nanoarchaeota archaeon]
MKKGIIFIGLVIFILSSIAVLAECPDGFTADDAGNCIGGENAVIPSDFTGVIDCSLGCTAPDGSSVTGNVEVTQSGIVLNEGASATTAAGGSVTAPATINNDGSISLEGGEYTQGSVTVSGTASMGSDGKWSVASGQTATINGVGISNADDIVPGADGKSLTGVAGPGGSKVCTSNGCMTFNEGDTINIDFNGPGGMMNINSGTATVDNDFTGNVNVGDDGNLKLPGGNTVTSGEVDMLGGTARLQPGATLENDIDGNGQTDTWTVNDGTLNIGPDGDIQLQGDVLYGPNGLGPQANFVNHDPNNPIDISNDCTSKTNCIGLDGTSLTVNGGAGINAEINLFETSITPGKIGYFDTFNSDVSSSAGDNVLLREGLWSGSGFVEDNRMEIPPMDVTGALIFNTLNKFDLNIDGRDYIYERDAAGFWTCATCDKGCTTCNAPTNNPNPPQPQATGFFSFIGRAWGWMTGKATDPSAITPCSLSTVGTESKNNDGFGSWGDVKFDAGPPLGSVEFDNLNKELQYIVTPDGRIVEVLAFRGADGKDYFIQVNANGNGGTLYYNDDGVITQAPTPVNAAVIKDILGEVEKFEGSDEIQRVLQRGSSTPLNMVNIDSDWRSKPDEYDDKDIVFLYNGKWSQGNLKYDEDKKRWIINGWDGENFYNLDTYDVENLQLNSGSWQYQAPAAVYTAPPPPAAGTPRCDDVCPQSYECATGLSCYCYDAGQRARTGEDSYTQICLK